MEVNKIFDKLRTNKCQLQATILVIVSMNCLLKQTAAVKDGDGRRQAKILPIDDFKYGNMSLRIAFFDIFGQSRLRWKDQN